MKLMGKAIAVAVAIVCVGRHGAGRRWTADRAEDDERRDARTNQIQIDSTRMRAESTGPTGGKQVDDVRRHQAGDDDDRHRQEDLQRDDQGRRRAARRADVRRDGAAAGADEEHAARAAREDGSGDEGPRARRWPGAARGKTQYKKVGTDKVGKWTCDKYEGYQRHGRRRPRSAPSIRRCSASPRPTSTSRNRWRRSSRSCCRRWPSSVPAGHYHRQRRRTGLQRRSGADRSPRWRARQTTRRSSRSAARRSRIPCFRSRRATRRPTSWAAAADE